MPIPNTLLTPAQLAERWGWSISHLANMRSAGAGPAYVKLGRSVRYRLADIEVYEAQALISTDDQEAA